MSTREPKPENPDYEASARALFARQGLMEAFGVEIRAIAPGACTLTVDYHGSRAKLQASIQGALLGAMADIAADLAVVTLVPKGSGVVTAEYKVSFLEPAVGKHIEARATVRRWGRTLNLAEVETVAVAADGEETLCALSLHTVMRLDQPPPLPPGRQAEGGQEKAAPAKGVPAQKQTKKKGLFGHG